MKRLRYLAALLLALAISQNVLAWGRWGHHISAYIAEQHLTEKANSECRRYLKHTLPYHASWQDYWRHCDGFKEISYWHSTYVDKDFKIIGHRGNITREATTQIERIVKEMEKGKYQNLPDSIVADNLKLLIHMVVDMHCPSHIGYTKDCGLKGYSIYNKGRKMGRHTFWDASPNMLHPKWRIERFCKEYDNYTPKQIKKICKGTPTKWGVQNAHKMVATFDMWQAGDDFQDLTAEQKRPIEELVHEQLAYAGYRLASILNNIFK